jgi:hypothetical protein
MKRSTCLGLAIVSSLLACQAYASVLSETITKRFEVKQGNTTLQTIQLSPCPISEPECNRTHRAWLECEQAALVRNPNPTATFRTFTMRTGSGVTLGTQTNQPNCEIFVRDRLRNAGVTRTTGSDVNTCTAITKYSNTGPVCSFAVAYLVKYGPNQTCTVPPATKDVNCPNGQGTWRQTSRQAAAPACTVTWEPAQPRATDCKGVARLTWTPPTRNTNGTTLTNLAGYRVIYWRDGQVAQTRQIEGAGVREYQLTGLTPAVWNFKIRAYTSTGAESADSNTVQRTVQAQ